MIIKLKSGKTIEVVPNDDFCAARYMNKETSEYVFDDEIEYEVPEMPHFIYDYEVVPISKRISKCRHKNAKKRRRGHRNLFWLVLSTEGAGIVSLFARKPNKEKIPNDEYRKYYTEDFRWGSNHSVYHPNGSVRNRLPVDKLVPTKVRLVICNDNPDLYMQRYKDCLFVNSHLVTYYIGGDRNRKVTQVPHTFRLSNKLFPDVTEESGIVGLKIVKY